MKVTYLVVENNKYELLISEYKTIYHLSKELRISRTLLTKELKNNDVVVFCKKNLKIIKMIWRNIQDIKEIDYFLKK